MAKEYWYYWTDPENCQGPFQDREECIAEARHDLDGEAFEIARGYPMKNQVPSFDDIDERFDDANEEYAGEQYPSEKWTKEHKAELVAGLTSLFDDWLDKHGYRNAWSLDLGPSETIPATLSSEVE